jgi:cytochrome b pre-mRNA-processing protein 3
MLSKLFRTRPEKTTAKALHDAIVAASRTRELYADLAVPDTLEGRFELVLLHAALVIDVLRDGDDPKAVKISQLVFDYMFEDFDIAMREMGVGDSGVGKKIRFMAEGFYGRAKGYTDALAADADNQAAHEDPPNEALSLVLARNVYAAEMASEPSNALARYVRQSYISLHKQGHKALADGALPTFAPV